jgi:hypothetical protein
MLSSFWWWDINSDCDCDSDGDSDGESDGELCGSNHNSEWEVPAPKKAKKPDTMMVEMDLKSIFENTSEAATRLSVHAPQHLDLLSSFVNQCTSTSIDCIT